MSVVICGLKFVSENPFRKKTLHQYDRKTQVHAPPKKNRCDMLFFFIKEHMCSLIELTYEVLSVMDTLPLIPNEFAWQVILGCCQDVLIFAYELHHVWE